jgi:hypothetical protein
MFTTIEQKGPRNRAASAPRRPSNAPIEVGLNRASGHAEAPFTCIVTSCELCYDADQ